MKKSMIKELEKAVGARMMYLRRLSSDREEILDPKYEVYFNEIIESLKNKTYDKRGILKAAKHLEFNEEELKDLEEELEQNASSKRIG